MTIEAITGNKTRIVTSNAAKLVIACRHPFSVDIPDPLGRNPRVTKRARWGKKTDVKFAMAVMMPIPAMPIARDGRTNSQAPLNAATRVASTSISTAPKRKTTKFFPQRIYLGGIGKRKSVVKLSLSNPRAL
jgi:hypothetical protein